VKFEIAESKEPGEKPGKEEDNSSFSATNLLSQGEDTAAYAKSPVNWERFALVVIAIIGFVGAALFVIRRRNEQNKDSYEVHYHVNGTSSKLDSTADLSFLKEYGYLPSSPSSPSRTASSPSSSPPRSLDEKSPSQSKVGDAGSTQGIFPISTMHGTNLDTFDEHRNNHQQYSNTDVDVDDEMFDDFFSVAKHPAKVDGRLGRKLPQLERNRRRIEWQDSNISTSAPFDEW